MYLPLATDTVYKLHNPSFCAQNLPILQQDLFNMSRDHEGTLNFCVQCIGQLWWRGGLRWRYWCRSSCLFALCALCHIKPHGLERHIQQTKPSIPSAPFEQETLHAAFPRTCMAATLRSCCGRTRVLAAAASSLSLYVQFAFDMGRQW